MHYPMEIEHPGAGGHITSRSNRKTPAFKDNRERVSVLDTLLYVHKPYNWIRT